MKANRHASTKSAPRSRAGNKPANKHVSREKMEQKRSKRRGWLGLLVTLLAIGAFVGLEFPFSALISQNASIKETQAQIANLSQENAAMSSEINKLNSPSEIEHIARRDFGLVKPGETAYSILPSSDAGSRVPPIPSHIVPGGSPSGEQDGALGTPSAPAPINPVKAAPKPAKSSPGFVDRLLNRLEFWK